MRLLVCGSRTWTDEESVRREIVRLAPTHVIHGAAKGADSVAAYVATMWACAVGAGLIVEPYPADWERDGKAAGPIRNARMLRDGKPTHGLAFGPLWRAKEVYTSPHHPEQAWKRTGTGDMVSRMLAARLPVRWVASPDAPAVDLTEMPPPPGT